MNEKLFRAYINKKPVTTIWRRTEAEAKEDLKLYRPGKTGNIISKSYSELLKNRKKTGFRGLI